MEVSISKKVLGLGVLLLSLFCALPASATILSCAGTLDAKIDPGLTAANHDQTISADASVASTPSCALVGTTVQPARIHIDAKFADASSCVGFALVPGSTVMTITWDDNSTGTASYTPGSPPSFSLSGPFAAQFLINSGHAAGQTMSISAGIPLSAALLACLLPGAAPVRHLGASISFSVT